jgi:hypothetical protein
LLSSIIWRARCGDSRQHALKAAMGVGADLGGVKVNEADFLALEIDRVAVDDVNFE